MASGDFFDEFLRNATNYNGGEPEYYEDTHDASGRYTGPRQYNPPPYGAVPPSTPPTPPTPFNQSFPSAQQQAVGSVPMPPNYQNPPQFVGVTPSQPQAKPLPTTAQYISPQLNQNFVVYRPQTTTDIEQLIAYLRRREPALVDLDPIADSPDAQRLMDFTSGAAYALGHSVMTVRRNLFLITPETIDVLKPESDG